MPAILTGQTIHTEVDIHPLSILFGKPPEVIQTIEDYIIVGDTKFTKEELENIYYQKKLKDTSFLIGMYVCIGLTILGSILSITKRNPLYFILTGGSIAGIFLFKHLYDNSLTDQMVWEDIDVPMRALLEMGIITQEEWMIYNLRSAKEIANDTELVYLDEEIAYQTKVLSGTNTQQDDLTAIKRGLSASTGLYGINPDTGELEIGTEGMSLASSPIIGTQYYFNIQTMVTETGKYPSSLAEYMEALPYEEYIKWQPHYEQAKELVESGVRPTAWADLNKAMQMEGVFYMPSAGGGL